MMVSSERGFALPFTLFVIAVITMLLAGILGQVQVDRRIAESVGDGVDATAIAQSGLQAYLATVNTDACYRAIRPLDGDSVRINVPGGYTDVIAHVLQEPTDTVNGTFTYVVRSTGFLIKPTAGADPQARHTIAQFANWQRGTIKVLAAFTAANGIAGGSTGTGEFQGVDLASPVACQTADTTAIRVSGASPSPFPHLTTGSMPNIKASGSGLDVANETGIDWASTIGGGIIPDYTTPQSWDASYPVMLITGNTTIAVADTWYYGTLIVTGDLTFTGTRLQWDGVVLVGGNIIFNNTDARFDGMVVTGLNYQIGGTPPQVVLGTGLIDFDFHSNKIRQALRSFAGFVPIENAWADNWATY